VLDEGRTGEPRDTTLTTGAPPPRVEDAFATPRQIVTAVVFGLIVMFVVPGLVDSFWLRIATSAVIYSTVVLGLGLLVGRVGMVSLYQFVLVAMGAWVALRLHFATSWPFPLILLGAGLITGIVGTLIGLPALRLSGLHLALITLMAAGGLTVILNRAQFPNGGGGFYGRAQVAGVASVLPRPDIALGDTAYYRYCVVVTLVLFLLVIFHVRGKPGRAWAALRQSQSTAVATGVNTTLYRMWAFALASFATGVAGGLLAAAAGGVSIAQFPVQNNITLLAVTLMGGVYSIWGAVVGAILLRVFPALLDDWGIGTEWLTVLFGIGVIQVLLTAPGGLVEQVPKDLANLGRKIRGLFRRPSAASTDPAR
jgi:branched-chain amino acid transport system permease protein